MSKKKTTPTNVTLILPPSSPVQLRPDRLGGKRDGLADRVQERVQNVVSSDALRNGFNKAMEQVKEIIKGSEDKNPPGWQLNTIEVALAISAEGSVGIATAGVEASITLSFERN